MSNNNMLLEKYINIVIMLEDYMILNYVVPFKAMTYLQFQALLALEQKFGTFYIPSGASFQFIEERAAFEKYQRRVCQAILPHYSNDHVALWDRFKTNDAGFVPTGGIILQTFLFFDEDKLLFS